MRNWEGEIPGEIMVVTINNLAGPILGREMEVLSMDTSGTSTSQGSAHYSSILGA